jgi:hypothetical protein
MRQQVWQRTDGAVKVAVDRAIDAVIEGWLDVATSKLEDWQSANHILDAYDITLDAETAEAREALGAWLVAAKAAFGDMSADARDGIESKANFYMNPLTGSVDTEDGWHPATPAELVKVTYDWHDLGWVEDR